MLGHVFASHSATRPKRVLLAHEFGAGRTHVANLLGVARRLRAAGVECAASLYDPRLHREFTELGIATVQSFVWPGWRRWDWGASQGEFGMFDLVANLGMSRPEAVAGAIAHYDGLGSLFEPDLVLAENAPGALLAGRDGVPTVAFGYGQLLPPADPDGNFPPFRMGDERVGWPVHEVLEAINAGLARSGRRPLGRPCDLLDVAAVLPFGPAAFDVYPADVARPLLAPNVPGYSPGMRAGDGDEMFVYLQSFALRKPAILAALLTLRRPVRAVLPDLHPDDRASLAGSGIVIEGSAVPIASIIERSRSMLHHGGIGLNAVCLAAGLPQTILSKELDNQVGGNWVAKEGLGHHRWIDEATTAWIVESARASYDDPALRQRCRARAPEFDGWFGEDPTRAVADAAFRLLGLEASGPVS